MFMRLSRLVGLLLLPAFALAAGQGKVCGRWAGWDSFKQAFLNEGGRVVDVDTPRKHTVSEGQAYAMFFALVANDRASFDKVLSWTEDNLAQGDLTAHLPAWQWGKRDDNTWGVIDGNAASDADLWMAYALSEAGRLWKERRYSALGQVLANRILREETENLPGLGQTLLPGPNGFKLSATRWRLNPSYVPLQVLKRMAAIQPSQMAWPQLLASSSKLLTGSAPHGFAPEWALYDAGAGFKPDAETRGEGSYNAIRVYLWLGMLAPQTPNLNTLRAAFQPMADTVLQKGQPPEKVNTTTGEVGPNAGPVGFSGAVLPYLASLGLHNAVEGQLQRIDALTAKARPGYYNQALSLFGRGWLEGRYRFDEAGALQTTWSRPCFTVPR